MLMEIDPLSMRGSMVMTMATISPSRRDVSPAEQLRRSPRLVSPRFHLETAESRPERWLMIFFSLKNSIEHKMAIGGPPGGPRGRGQAQQGRARPHPRGQGVAPLVNLSRLVFIIYYANDFREVSGLLELCRIGLQYFLLFQPRIPAAGILPLHVNLVK